LRYEQNQRVLHSATTDGPVTVNQKDRDILPSVNISYNLTEKSLIRAAYGKTLNRPEFRENAPFAFFDFDYNYVVSGFPYLVSADIHNFDLRWEYYPNLSEVFSLAVFYKKFKNAIEQVFLPGAGSAGSKNFSFGNSGVAGVYGLEIEIRKSLAGLTANRFIDNLNVVMNGSLLNSTVKIGTGSRSEGRDTDPRPLQGQSPYLLNTGIFYNNIKSDLQLNISYNIIGPRINSAGYTELDKTKVSYPDVYEMPRHLMDITISKRLNKYLSLKVGIADIFNQESILLQDGNQDDFLDQKNDQIIQALKPGASYSIGLSFKL
jgi:outer membrane receptor protein involved in Fe transport